MPARDLIGLVITEAPKALSGILADAETSKIPYLRRTVSRCAAHGMTSGKLFA
jgi:hypothetical protein